MSADTPIKPLRGELIIYLLPPVLIITFYLLFHFLAAVAGNKEGYLLGMSFYWLLGCLVPAFLWINRANRKFLLSIKKINWWQFILLLLPIVLALSLGPFRQRISEATALIIIASLPYAVINAFCEEFMWRGLFFAHHQGNYFHAVVVPSIWFGIWQYVPLSIHPAFLGNFYFVLSTIGLGLCWATVTYFTRSIFWSIVSHALTNFSGLGLLYYFS